MKIRVRFPLKVGRTYYTACGLKVRIYSTNGGGYYPVHGAFLKRDVWSVSGWTVMGRKSLGCTTDLDILYEEWEPADKELVWAWDSNKEFSRRLGFYDAKNNKLFNFGSGTRNGYHFSKYAPYEGEWPEWAKEAVKNLED